MVNFGEFLQAEVERPEAKHTRVFFVDYHALKERLCTRGSRRCRSPRRTAPLPEPFPYQAATA